MIDFNEEVLRGEQMDLHYSSLFLNNPKIIASKGRFYINNQIWHCNLKLGITSLGYIYTTTICSLHFS